MLGQFVLNLFIAALWFLLKDDPQADFSTFVAGFLVGIVILYAMHRFFGTRFYLQRVEKIIKLILIFIRELILSSMSVLRYVLSPKLNITPGIFTYETKLEGDWQITALALLLTLTPGSVVMEVSEKGNLFYIHAMDLEEAKDSIVRSIGKFEQAILEVTRND
ncbi:Na+/H+ antiporter subunit E [Lysinibacillus odysseyi]|uniref:Monovalent cation/H+ antiporter subunit E n=1 Tax=Lysinibacillus odysseyi 34hs-1 = NBRC 100172 TaxID=1220589 RepID=A0A0A3IR09_9BACI|nr:Na+/H+ antiporter subunit E [Lysinibacillus odysseyi]KGR87214.1 monovalent cation/H+ antiporter subunit E [Lysinibacillus odysseyi 34hs-1 = NBRC 100172]